MIPWMNWIRRIGRKRVIKLRKKLSKLFEKTVHNDIFVMETAFFIGLSIIIFTNFSVNVRFGMYSLGGILIAFSIFLYKFTGKRGENK